MGKTVDTDTIMEWVQSWFVKNKYYHPYSKQSNIPISELYDILEQMPPAQPEPQWIPVSERLPEDSEYHLVTEYHMVSFARYWEHRWWDAFGDKAKFVTAWMPLPEPYGGKEKSEPWEGGV